MTALTSGQRSLTRGREAIAPAMDALLERLDPASREVAAYHLAGGGKHVRGALALLAALAVGGREADGLPGALAVELVHNFSLLHDDLMDGDVERRHRPTVWALHGTASAVLVGDAMLALATEVLLDVGSSAAARAARTLAVATRELVRGQTEDLAFERRRDVTPEECSAMAAGKTGALLEASLAVGAVLGGGSSAQVAALSAYGCSIGLAFQLVDDLLGIWGDPATTGKAVLADLRARKMSLPVTWALAAADPAAAELAAWYATAPGGDDHAALARAADLVEATGARAWAAGEVGACVATAREALAACPDLDPGAVAELLDLAVHLAGRDA